MKVVHVKIIVVLLRSQRMNVLQILQKVRMVNISKITLNFCKFKINNLNLDKEYDRDDKQLDRNKSSKSLKRKSFLQRDDRSKLIIQKNYYF
jgi:hypothetical protein